MLNKLREMMTGSRILGDGQARKAADQPDASAYRRAVEEAKAMGDTPPTRAEWNKKR